jgi:hypothetical protein
MPNRDTREAGPLERGIAFTAMIATIVLVAMLAVAGFGSPSSVEQWVAALTPVVTAPAGECYHLAGSCER